MNLTKLAEQLKRHEGFVSAPTPCPAGHPSIGHGHNLDAKPWTPEQIDFLGADRDWLRKPMTRSEADVILLEDIADAYADALHLVDNWDLLTDARQACLVNLVFNMGFSKVALFKGMIAEIECGDWDGAAWQLKDSRWFRPAGVRGPELVEQLRTGKWA
jgi:lysozyme